MATNFIITNSGKTLILNRVFKAVPDYGQVTRFKVGINNPVPSVTDTDLSTAVEISAGVYFEDIDSTSPEFNVPFNEVTITGFLNSLQAVGNDLNAIGLFNSDGTPIMFSEITHEEESKNDTDEFSYSMVFRQL